MNVEVDCTTPQLAHEICFFFGTQVHKTFLGVCLCVVRMPISRAFMIKGVGYVMYGRVEQGMISLKDRVCLYPCGAAGKVKSIEMYHKPQSTAIAGLYLTCVLYQDSFESFFCEWM